MDPISTIQLVASAAALSKEIAQRASAWVSKSHRSLGRRNHGASSREQEYGLDVVNENGRKHDVDIYFVHGLTGNRKLTWKLDGDKSSGFWPGELLVHDARVGRARILTYGYDSDFPSSKYLTERTLYHQAGELLVELSRVRQDDCHRRLIFVCHTLGGILVQSALILALASKNEAITLIQHSTKGIILLDTPFSGRMPDDQWSKAFIRLVHVTAPSKQGMERNSKKLKIMLEPFVAASSDILIKELTASEKDELTRVQDRKSSISPQKDEEMALETFHGLGHVSGKTDPKYELLVQELANICRNSRQSKARKLRNQDYIPKLGNRLFKLPRDLPCRAHNHVSPGVDIGDLFRKWTKTVREHGLVVCLHGRAGTGMNQLALEYAHRRGGEFTSVFWISAESKQSIELGFHGIGNRLLEHYSSTISKVSNLSEQNARLKAAEMLGLREVVQGTDMTISPPTLQASHVVTEAVRDWFNRAENPKWLLILDGMDAPDLAECLSLMPMPRQNGLILITRRETWSPSHAMRTRVVFENISRLQKTNPDKLHGNIEHVPHTGNSSVQGKELQSRLDGLSETEQRLLACCSLFPGEFIPIRFFSVNNQTLHLFDAEYTDDMNGAIFDALNGLSGLVTVRREFEDVIAEDNRATKWRNKLDPGVMKTVETVIWQCMVSFASDLSENSLSAAIASLNQKRLVDMIKSYSTTHGIMSLQALSTYDYLKLATLCFNRGYQNTAESVADYARQRLSRPELHTEASVRLVELYINLKRTAKAQALFTRMKKTAAKPSVTRGFSISFRKLDARMRELNGRADEAITMLRNAMTEEDVEKRNSPSENVTMGALEDLVNCLIRKHNYEMAEPLLRRQLLTFERVYGSNSPAAIGILEKLSSVFLAQGNLEDTEDALVRVNESNKARLGVDHPKTQACALELAGILDQRGQHDQASKLYDCALELFEGWHGPADPDSLKVRIRRAECFEARQMNEEALKDYRMALEACEKEAGVERRTHNQDIDELKGMLMRYLAAPDEVLEQHSVSKRGAVLSKSSILSS